MTRAVLLSGGDRGQAGVGSSESEVRAERAGGQTLRFEDKDEEEKGPE